MRSSKQYSRNLGTGEGIELILLHSDPIPGDIDSDGDVDANDLDSLPPEDPNDPNASTS